MHAWRMHAWRVSCKALGSAAHHTFLPLRRDMRGDPPWLPLSLALGLPLLLPLWPAARRRGRTNRCAGCSRAAADAQLPLLSWEARNSESLLLPRRSKWAPSSCRYSRWKASAMKMCHREWKNQ